MQLSDLGPTLRHTARLAERNGILAMRNTAVYGKKAAIRTAKTTRDPFRIRASGEYQHENNWKIQNVPMGAILSPTTKHALFVERGRKPGKKPPYQSILMWAYQKKIGLRKGGAKHAVMGTPRTQRIVSAIQFKIAKKGTKGRWPLKRTMPKIAKQAQRELNKAVRASLGKRPIKRRRKKGA
jgi:hypothetical protein